MYKLFLNRLLPLLLLLGGSAQGQEFELDLRIQDEQRQPLANAVIEIEQRPLETAPEEVALIDQVDREFVPMVIAVGQGQRVNFPNSDNVRHHVYSFSPIKNFSTRLYADEPTEPVQFPETGIATLGCNIHDSMVAWIYVSAWRDVAVTREDGHVNFADLDGNPGHITVWHPWMDEADNRRRVDVSDLSDGQTLTLTLPITPPEEEGGFSALTPES